MEPLHHQEAAVQLRHPSYSEGKPAPLPPKDIEESLEDPFSLKLFPEDRDNGANSRCYNLGKSLRGRAVFSVSWTSGSKRRVVFARDMTASEHVFFERKKADLA
jgi:hypothetical protein